MRTYNFHDSKANLIATRRPHKAMKTFLYILMLFLCLAVTTAARAQAPPDPPFPMPPPPEPALEQPAFDPYHAEKSIEVGRFYMKKGNYDAALERFQDAAAYKPNFALPYRLMGEVYEKKGDKAAAVKAYQKYLEIYPSAEDAAKLRKHLEKLSRDLQRAAAHRHSS